MIQWINPVFDREPIDVVFGNEKGSWMASVLNRIEGNIRFIRDELLINKLQLIVPQFETKTNWTRQDYLFLGDLQRIHRNMLLLRRYWSVPIWTPRIPEHPWIQYHQVNDVERFIFLINEAIEQALSISYNAGMRHAFAGVNWYFVKSDVLDRPARPVFVTLSLPTAIVDHYYSVRLQIVNTDITGLKLEIIGELPRHLTMDNTGHISGIPFLDGNYQFGVRATNVAGSTEQMYSLQIMSDDIRMKAGSKLAYAGLGLYPIEYGEHQYQIRRITIEGFEAPIKNEEPITKDDLRGV